MTELKISAVSGVIGFIFACLAYVAPAGTCTNPETTQASCPSAIEFYCGLCMVLMFVVAIVLLAHGIVRIFHASNS